VTLAPGTHLGPYEITSRVGAGGMGEVYRAVDTRLGRDVAIKVLPAELSANAQLRARFDREARAISNLNHPNICTLFDVGREGETDFLVMELLDGEALAERLARGPLTIDLAVRTALEVADALDRAHSAGIVHRDLKPGNIILTKSGAKLLDFGLAKTVEPALGSPDSVTAQITDPLTTEGMIVGTFQYMAPEQIERGEADARSDIFAFGAVLYEMITGKRAFEGSSRASTIAKVLAGEPPPISEVQPMTPIALDRLVRTCLAKDPADRFQTVHDLIIALQWIRDERRGSVPSAIMRRSRAVKREPLAWSVAAIAVVVAVAIALLARFRPTYPFRTETLVAPPPETRFVMTGDYGGPPVLSSDGRNIAFVAAGGNTRRTLWVRPLAGGAARSIEGTANAQFPFWSPDGRTVAFFADNMLKSVDISGGPVVNIAPAGDARGGAWNEDGVIVYARATRDGLWRVSASGGQPVKLTTPSGNITSHRWPLFLPGGKWLIYLRANHNDPTSAETSLHLLSLDGKEDRPLFHTLAGAVYASGRLLFMRDSTLVAQPFDTWRKRLTGTPSVLAQNVRFDLSTWHGIFDASQNGVLTYQVGGPVAGTRLAMVDATGHATPFGELAKHSEVRVSPDGKRLAVAAGDPRADIFIVDLEKNIRSRLTFEGSHHVGPLWSPDGSEVFYGAAERDSGAATIYVRPANGGGQRRAICCGPGENYLPMGITPDGKTLLAVKGYFGARGAELVTIPAAGGTASPIVKGSFDVIDARFAPDGRFIAYTATESGRPEIYVIPYPQRAGKWQVSNGGGRFPRWSHDGARLYYAAPDETIVAVDVKTNGETLEIGQSHPLFRLQVNPTAISPFDVGADDRIISAGTEEDSAPLTVVTNWLR